LGIFHEICSSTDELAIDFINSHKLLQSKPSPLKLDLSSVITNKIAFCLFTSGTTGPSSLVQHRHQDVLVMNENYGRSVLHLTEDDTIFATSRFYFAYGLNALFFALLNGAKLLLTSNNMTPEMVWRLVISRRPTVLFSVPTMYKRLIQSAPQDCLVDSLRLCVSAGEHLPLQISDSWLALTGQQIIDGIGTTEVLSTFISNSQRSYKPGSTGRVVPGFVAELRNSNSEKLVGDGAVGILWIKGETYVGGYLNNEVESSERFVDGWFKTNDLFSVDEEGYYFYHGRVNDLIKISGIWTYPYSIEQVLQQHPAVSEAVVSGYVESDGLTRLIGYVVPREGCITSAQLTQELKNWCRMHAAKHEYPHFIEYLKSIPRTLSGKVKRYLLSSGTYKESNNAS